MERLIMKLCNIITPRNSNGCCVCGVKFLIIAPVFTIRKKYRYDILNEIRKMRYSLEEPPMDR